MSSPLRQPLDRRRKKKEVIIRMGGGGFNKVLISFPSAKVLFNVGDRWPRPAIRRVDPLTTRIESNALSRVLLQRGDKVAARTVSRRRHKVESRDR